MCGGGKAYVSTVINAPAVDHIYLFRSIEDVLSLVYESGLSVAEYACYTEQDVEIERAIKNKMAINIAMILE